jgi:hypothetical protein
MPFVYKVIQSDLFLVDTEDTGSASPTTTPFTNLAFFQCNAYIKTKLSANTTATFPDKPINSWSLGGYQYLINSEFTVNKENAATQSLKYTCRISYKNGKNEEGSADADNWSIDGITGIDDL